MRTGDFVGLEPDRLSLKQRLELAGKWIALEKYDPRTLPERRILALGATPAECLRELRSHGIDPAKCEVVAVSSPYRNGQ